jgi:hypothetical protein
MSKAFVLCALGLVACGNDSVDPSPDGPGGNRPDPRVIAGGGIGDGPIDGVVNLYVIDDATRDPIEGAEVSVGSITGLTDATGLFVAEGVTGKQDITVTAPGKRAELWVGANGANVTVDVNPMFEDTPASAQLAGTITGWTSITVGAGHVKEAFVTYSQTDDLGDPANELAQTGVPGCLTIVPTDPCNFSVTSRTGKVALIAAIFDRDTKNTQAPEDDTRVLIGWALRQGITATGGTQAGNDLAIIPANQLQTVSVDFGAPPAALTQQVALVGIEIGDEGVFQLPVPATTTATALLAPKLTGVAGATGYRLTAIASNGAPTDGAQSVVLRRALAGPALAAGTWLAPPTAVTISRTSATWTNAADAVVHSIELRAGSSSPLNVTVFDGSTAVTLPAAVALPSGALSATLNAIGATGFDVENFSLDADLTKLDHVSGQAKTVN